MIVIDGNKMIVDQTARFSVYSEGVIRMEYAWNGSFEDRTSMRATDRREIEPLSVNHSTEMKGKKKQYVIETSKMKLCYTPDGKDFSDENIYVCDKDNNIIWWPSKEDRHNLGGVHLGMDCIQRSVIPEGVHVANTNYHDNSTSHHLWRYVFGNSEEVEPDAHYAQQTLSLEQLIALKGEENLSEPVRNLLTERRKYPPGPLSRSGYFLYNDSDIPVVSKNGWYIDRNEHIDNHKSSMDYYLFVYGKDYKKALKDYKAIFGTTPMIPRYSLGLWFSRYPTFKQQEIEELITTFDDYELPLDVMVLDLEWHKRGWFGFDWDEQHFPRPDELLSLLKEKGIYTTFNVHPDGIPYDDSKFEQFIDVAELNDTLMQDKETDRIYHNIDLSRQKTADAFMNILHKPVMEQGMDFWWIDGAARSEEIRIGEQFMTNEVYMRHMKEHFHMKRSLIMSRTEGLGSHRYPFHFTGDTYSQFEVLRSQVEYTLRAGHMGLSFMTHDIGGHMCNHKHMDSELLARWYQFGAMSPVFRLHSSGGSERIPWRYSDKLVESLKNCMKFRMTLLPYLYHLVHESHNELLPMVRSNELMNPEWEQGYTIYDSYYLGDRVYCTPILAPGNYRKYYLPPGIWYNTMTESYVESSGEEAFTLIQQDTELPPHFIKAEKILIKQPYEKRAGDLPKKIIVEFYQYAAEGHDSYVLYEDDGVSNTFQSGQWMRTKFDIRHKRGSEPEIAISVIGTIDSLGLADRNYELHMIGPYGKAIYTDIEHSVDKA